MATSKRSGGASTSSKKSQRIAKYKLGPEQKQKIKGLVLIGIGLFILVFVGSFLYDKLLRPRPLAEILPAGTTIGLLEINIEENDSQVKQFHEIMRQHYVYGGENMKKLVHALLPVDFEQELEPWLGRKIGLAMTQTPLLLIESADHNLAKNFLASRAINGESLKETPYGGTIIYEFPVSQNFVFTFVHSYLVLAENKEALTQYLDTLAADKLLSEDATYQKVANNLPQHNLAFAYANMQKLTETLQKDPTFAAQKGQDLLAFKPFLDLFKAEGYVLVADRNHLNVQSFTFLNKTDPEENPYITYDEKYRGRLLNYLSGNTVFLAAGHNLTLELKRLEEIFDSGSKTPSMMFDGLLDTQIQKYFGGKVGLREDIYPLLTGEYAVALEEGGGINLLLELESEEGSPLVKLDKIVDAFVEASGFSTETVQQVTLEDGTVGHEIIAQPETVTRTTETANSVSSEVLKVGTTGVEIRYAVLDDLVAFSNSAESLKNIIVRHNDSEKSNLTSSDLYKNSIAPLMRSADQLAHVKLGAFRIYLELFTTMGDEIGNYMAPIDTITISKNFFDDGISTIYRMEIN